MTATLDHRSSGSQLRQSSRLTPMDVRVLAEIASGATLDVAARRLDVSTRTVRRRVRDACDRIDVGTPIEAAVWAAKHELI